MSTIIEQIVNKFPSDYASAASLTLADLALTLALALAYNKRNAFWKRYDTDEAFKKQINSSYAYRETPPWYPDFWVVTQEPREYLKPELQNAELLLKERDKVRALKISDVSSALEIAENVEEFKQLILDEKSFKQDMWLKLEKRLNETRIK